MVEKNCSYRDDDVTNHINFFENLCKKQKMAKSQHNIKL